MPEKKKKSTTPHPSKPSTIQTPKFKTPQVFMQAYSYELVYDGKTKKEREVKVQQNSSSKEPKVSIIEKINGKTVKPTTKSSKTSTKPTKKTT